MHKADTVTKGKVSSIALRALATQVCSPLRAP